MDRELIVATLRATPALLSQLTRDCPPGPAGTRPGPEDWSIAEVVRHLVQGERDTFLPRLRRMLAEERPVFTSRAPAEGDPLDLPRLLEAFATARRQSVETLAGLDERGWGRPGVSPSRGPLTVETYARSMADHDTEHLGQIHDRRAGLGLGPKRCEARRPLPMGELVGELGASLPRLAAVAEGLTAAQLRHRPRDGEWCINEVMAHLLHLETELFLDRLRRIAREDRPAFESFSPEAWARERDRSLEPFAASLQALTRARQETIAFLRALPAPAAERVGLSAFFGPVTLAQYATHIVDHDLEHLAQMRECRRIATGG